MGLSNAERKRRERERRQAKWMAEEERVRKLGELFEALPDCPQKAALKEAMTDRIIDLYNNVRWQEGDAILEFLPNDYARRLLDWYFDEDENASFPAEAAASEHDASQSGQIQGEPQSDQRPDGEHSIEAPAELSESH